MTCFEIFFDDPAETEQRNFLTADTYQDSRDYLVTGSSDWTAKLWAIKSGTFLKTFSGHNGAILSLAVDISQRVLFTASADQTIKKWDVVSGEYRQTLKGHNASVTKIAVKDKLRFILLYIFTNTVSTPNKRPLHFHFLEITSLN